jgi:tetratricopeptide (TPR) repeat protein/transcriptional regulator with XRE-family HTH domain
MAHAQSHVPNLRLRQARLERQWSQQDLAEQIGTTAANVSRWERGITFPSPYYRHSLCALFDKHLSELGFVSHTMQATNKQLLWTVPYQRNPFFVGRAETLRQMRDHCETECLPLALCGLGGIGKTQLAVEYAYRYAGDYTAVLWLEAETDEGLIWQIVALADLLNLPDQQEVEQNRTIAAVMRWLREHPGWLMVLDNVEDLRLVNKAVPSNVQGNVILTTRRQVTEPIAHAIDMDVLGESDGALFLLRRTKRLSLHGALDDASREDVIAARTLARQMGGLPLALDQAGAYVLETGSQIAAYIDLLQQRQATLLQRRGAVPTDHPLSVAATLGLSLEQIELASDAASALLQCCAFLHPDAIPLDFFRQAGASLGSPLQEAVQANGALDPLLALLRQYSLVWRSSTTNTLSIHRIVQAILRDRMTPSRQRLWVERIVHALYQIFPDGTYVENFALCRQYQSHALACASLIHEWQIHGREAAQLVYRIGNYLRKQGIYSQAEALLMQALTLQRECLGDDHAEIADILNDLGLIYSNTEQFQQAETVLQQAKQMREQLFGSHHQALAESCNNLGFLYDQQGQYAQAEPYHQKALAIVEQINGPEHPDMAYHLGALAYVYNAQEQYEQAEPLLKRAIAIQEKTIGAEHPDSLHCLNNLGYLYMKQARYEEAEVVLQRGLAISVQIFSLKHPQSAYFLTNLGSLHHGQRHYELAIDYFQRALAIRRDLFGAEHGLVAKCLVYIGQVLHEQGKGKQAVTPLREALAILEKLGSLNSSDAKLGYACLQEILAEHSNGQYAGPPLVE